MIIRLNEEFFESICVVCAIQKTTTDETLYYIATDSTYIFRILNQNDIDNHCQILDSTFPKTWIKDKSNDEMVFSFPEMIAYKEMKYCLAGLRDDCKNAKFYHEIFRKRYREILEDYVLRTYGTEEKFYEIVRKKELQNRIANNRERGWELDDNIQIKDLEFLPTEDIVMQDEDAKS